jgi:molecular chaperone GrpE
MNQDDRFDADTQTERNQQDAERFANATDSGASEPETDRNDTEEPQIVETDLTDELEKERARSAEYLDQAQRTRAELINYRRRTEQEIQVARRFAAEHLIGRILPVIDDFHRAIDAVPDADKDNPWVQGVLLIDVVGSRI